MPNIPTTLEIGADLSQLSRARETLREMVDFAGKLRDFPIGASMTGGGFPGGGAAGMGGSAAPTLFDPYGRPLAPSSFAPAPPPAYGPGAAAGSAAAAAGAGGGGDPTGGGGFLGNFLLGGALSGRKLTGLAGMGFAGLALHRAMGTGLDIYSQYQAQAAVEASGLGSGEFGQAAPAAIQAYYGRERATTVGGWQMAGGIAGGGLMAAGSAALLSGAGAPVGAALMALGAVAQAGADFGARAADAMLNRLQASEQAAMSSYQRYIGVRERFASAGLQVAALGGAPVSEAEVLRNGPGGLEGFAQDYGYSGTDIQERLARFRRAGGAGLGTGTLLAAERGLGLSAEVLGGLARTVVPGQGEGRLSGSSPDEYIRETIAGAMAAGLDRARLPEYLQRIASINAAFRDRGIPLDAEALQRAVASAQQSGLSPYAATAAVGTMNQQGAGLLQQMAGMRLPAGMAQALLMRQAIQEHGTFEGAMEGLEETLAAGEMPRFIRETAGDLGGGPLATAMMMQMTGLGPRAARDFLGGPKGGDFGDARSLEEYAQDVTQRPEFVAEQTRALGTSMELLATNFQDLATYQRQYLQVVQTGIAEWGAHFPAAISRLNALVGGVDTGRVQRGDEALSVGRRRQEAEGIERGREDRAAVRRAAGARMMTAPKW